MFAAECVANYHLAEIPFLMCARGIRRTSDHVGSAIEYQVINGKNNMPAFGGRLTDDQITDAAYYVIYQTQQGWNRAPLYVSKCRPSIERSHPLSQA